MNEQTSATSEAPAAEEQVPFAPAAPSETDSPGDASQAADNFLSHPRHSFWPENF